MIITTHGAAQPGAPGLYGGFPCALNSNVVMRDADARRHLVGGRIVLGANDVTAAQREVLEAKARTSLSPADMLITRNEGGPGCGDPLRRGPERVARDVRTGLCRPEDARDIYGVVLRGDQADPDGTFARRAEMRRARLADARPVQDAVQRYGVEGALAGARR